MNMWEPFTEQARQSIVHAQKEALRLGNNYIGIEHLLLGILAQPSALAQRLLASGIDLEQARAQLALPSSEHATGQEMVFTHDAKRIIEMAFEEARQVRANYIGPEMLLLAILKQCDERQGSAIEELLKDRKTIEGDLRRELRRE